ncbi:tyrosine-type recombinase/integrase [Curtobacterium flaccumfaciens]|uniref:tyrosine-type recombinase/integrase n=1 Tax=Curtobacterium flaccumfaciens TaxID=2035 RepID=UPI001FD7F81F|nr:site-specific integrase [Curtobacterium flaccumfaciens]
MASVKQRPNGHWRARYRDDDGKEHAKHFALKREAQAWLNEVASAQLTGTYVAPAASRGTLEEFYAEWSRDQLWTENTRRLADRAVGECTFRSVPFGRLRRSHGEAYIKQLANRLAPTTVKTRAAYVRIALRAAILDRRLANDPLEGVKLPAVRKKEHAMRVPSPAEVQSIRDAIEPARQALIDVMAYAGLRIGEAAGLQVGDIDFLRRTIHVERQIQNEKQRLVVLPPKHRSERLIPVPDELLNRLARHIEHVGVHGDEGWLFGRPPSPAGLRHNFNDACDVAKVHNVTPHDLRHHYASGLIRGGLDAVAVSKALGHSSPGITLDVYAHLWPDAADRTRAAATALMSSWSDSADDLRTAPPIQPLQAL